MLDTEAALARAAERAGLAPAGAGAAVTAAADAGRFDAAALGRPGGPHRQPGARRWSGRWPAAVPPWAAGAVHRGATSQDILDTAAMLVAGARCSVDPAPTWPPPRRPRPAWPPGTATRS